MAFITVCNLSLGYDSRVIMKNLNFSVYEGDYLCVVGENGSGKTTLMKTLLRLQEPLGGEILFGGGLKSSEIGYLPQQTEIQKDFPASVREIVLSGCLGRCGNRPIYGKAEKKKAQDNMEQMGIANLAHRSFRDLSGGQKQRVLLARALCAAGKVLLLDEPVSGLDPNAAAEMYELIERLNKNGVTVIMISHDLSAALFFASHILHIGQPVFFGSKEEYQNSTVGMRFMAAEKGGGQDA